MRIISERQRSLVFYQSPPSVTQEWEMLAVSQVTARSVKQSCRHDVFLSVSLAQWVIRLPWSACRFIVPLP
jgi:hypothetical protein